MKAINPALALTTLLALPAISLAAAIEGDIGIGGMLHPTCGGVIDETCTMAVADGVSFAHSGESEPGAGDGNRFLVDMATEDFAADPAIFFGARGTINDFAFRAPTGPSTPINPLWTIGEFSFRLETIRVARQTGSFLSLMGAGFVMHPDFADTHARWSFSSDSARGARFSWSSTTAAPEPGMLLLMGMGLIGLFGVRGHATRG